MVHVVHPRSALEAVPSTGDTPLGHESGSYPASDRHPRTHVLGESPILDALAVARGLVVADPDCIGYACLIEAQQASGHTGGGHVAEQGGEVPPVLVDALARPGGQAKPGDEVGADGEGRDELLAADPLRRTR